MSFRLTLAGAFIVMVFGTGHCMNELQGEQEDGSNQLRISRDAIPPVVDYLPNAEYGNVQSPPAEKAYTISFTPPPDYPYPPAFNRSIA